MEVSGHRLQLYCDWCPPDRERSKAEFTGESRGDCRAQAKRAGWMYHGSQHYCKKCRCNALTEQAPSAAVPEPLTMPQAGVFLTPSEHASELGYVMGWNACRAAMLSRLLTSGENENDHN